MKAFKWTTYGSPDGLQITELEKPSPRQNEVLIRIYAATVTTGDCEVRNLKFPIFIALPMRLFMGFRKPNNKILGQELAGGIEALGEDVKLFRKGEQVYAATGMNMGAYAEYICLPQVNKDDEGVLALKPSNMSYEETACHYQSLNPNQAQLTLESRGLDN